MFYFSFLKTSEKAPATSPAGTAKIPKPTNLSEKDNKLLNQLKNDMPTLINLVNNQNLNEFIKKVVSYSFEANKYFNDSEPWSVKKKNLERMQNILFTICEQIKNISILLNCIIPVSTGKVLKAMNVEPNMISIKNINNMECFNYSNELKNLNILFNKVENDN